MASVSERSPIHWIFKDLALGKYNLCVSNEILMEYEEIVDKFMGNAVAEKFINALLLLPNVELITVFYHWGLIEKDKDDNKFSDCTVAAGADYLASQDTDFKVLNSISFPKIEVINLEQFRLLLYF